MCPTFQTFPANDPRKIYPRDLRSAKSAHTNSTPKCAIAFYAVSQSCARFVDRLWSTLHTKILRQLSEGKNTKGKNNNIKRTSLTQVRCDFYLKSEAQNTFCEGNKTSLSAFSDNFKIHTNSPCWFLYIFRNVSYRNFEKHQDNVRFLTVCWYCYEKLRDFSFQWMFICFFVFNLLCLN